MTNDPNVPPYQPYPPQPPQYGQHPQQQGYGQGQPYPPQFQQGPYPPQGFVPPVQPPAPGQGPKPPKGPFGTSFWIVGALLTIVVLLNAFAGQGEGILAILGVSAALTGLYSLIFKRRSWAALGSRRMATVVALAGAASLLIGVIAGVAGVSHTPQQVQTAAPATSAQLEADAAARLKTREDAVVKSEADSAAKLKMREDAVAAREAAVGTAEQTAAANVIKEGTWTVGKDIAPGTYRTAKELTSSCYWAITRTGSNGSDIIENDNVKGGFPQVVLSDGQTFESSRCGSWAKQ